MNLLKNLLNSLKCVVINGIIGFIKAFDDIVALAVGFVRLRKEKKKRVLTVYD